MMLLIRKSQMNLFDHHEEQRTVHAGTRHLQNGAVVQVAEHQRRTVVAAPHAQSNTYSAPLVTRENVSALINDFLAPMNITFEYGKSSELRGKNGWAFPGERRIITRKGATIDDLAHEISHIVQYDLRGETRCSSDRQQGELGSEHTTMTKEYTEKLKQNKLGYLFQKANGITWRTMNQDIGAGIATDPRIAQADREYAEWQAQQAPPMETMVAEARRWKGAAMNADEDLGNDTRARLRHSRMTTKGDLDEYLIRKFRVDVTTARDVSNYLTQHDIPADRSVEPSAFAGEPWSGVTKSLSLTHLLRKSKEKVSGYIRKKTGKLVYNYERDNWKPKWNKIKEGQHTAYLPNGRMKT